MKYIELQEAFELEINQIDNSLDKPKSIDIEYWLNKGLERFYKTRYSGINYKQLGFEQNQKRIDDLRTLINTKYYILNDESWYLLNEDSSKIQLKNKSNLLQEESPDDEIHIYKTDTFYIYIPNDYILLLGNTAGITPIHQKDIECANKDASGNIIPTYSDTIEATIETIDSIVRNSLSEHHFKYLSARPIRLVENNKILLITDGNYKISEYKLTYLRRPVKIDIHKFPYDEYTDMPQHTHSEIVKLAVAMYLENQRSDRYNTYSTEVNIME